MSVVTRRRKRQSVAAGGLPRRQTQTCLPDNITGRLPSCAFQCILDFSRQNYAQNDCSSTSDFEQLCTNRTRSGTTIGEASLQCLASNCANQASNELLLAAYNICVDIDNAVPNTATVLNATIRPTTTSIPGSTTNALVAVTPTAPPTTSTATSSIPSVTGLVVSSDGSRIISGDGMSVTMEIRMSPSSSNSAASPTMTEMRSNFMPEEMPPMNTGLSTVQIAGIGAGAGLAGLLVIALLFLFFRRRKQAKEDKSAFSKQISSPDTDTSQISSWGASRPRQPPVDKRRSFWRVSIKPEEIGIAVSERPGKRESGSSQVSMPKQPTPTMPARYADPRSSWPSLTRVNAAAPPRPPRDSVATIFDEDIEQQPNGPPRVSVGGVNFALAEPVKSSRARNTPQPLQLNQQAVPSPIFSAATSSALPLTPTYDNGNFIATPNRSIAPNSIDAALAATLPVSSMAPGGSDNVSPTPSPRRNRLQKKSSPKKPPPTAASYPTRQDSMSTEFDTDTTPGEDERRLETKASSPLAVIPQSPQSPISNLRYPSVPESAAVSPQARGNHAQPQQVVRSPSLTQFPLPNSDRQRRNTLFRNDQSFITIDSVSSEGRNSDYSIEWPVPPTNRPQDLGPLSPLSRIMNRATVETQYSIQRASEAHLSPSSQATITPGSKPGDLFFKVVMR